MTHTRYLDRVANGRWKELYTYRQSVDRKVSAHLENILTSQTNRFSQYKAIASYGYDAKDTLLRHFDVTEHTEDYLARR